MAIYKALPIKSRIMGACVAVVLFGLPSSVFGCGGWYDIACNVGKAIEKGFHDVGNAFDEVGQEIGDGARNLDRERLKGTENVFRELKLDFADC